MAKPVGLCDVGNCSMCMTFFNFAYILCQLKYVITIAFTNLDFFPTPVGAACSDVTQQRVVRK